MKLKPLFDRVIVKEEKQEASKHGIFLGSSCNDSPRTGNIVFVGDGNILDNGNKSEMLVKIGDKVLFNKFAGIEALVDNEQVYIIRQTDILAIIE